jgi:hypothetical protein
MKKLLIALPFLMLAGCELYFGGDSSSSGSWNYCGSDGYYQCDQNNNCTLVDSTCPPGTSGGDSGGSGGTNGYECGSNSDCAAGCYCTAQNVCEEGGFCTSDSDCGSGYFCDTTRSSCEPNPVQTTSCSSNTDCTGAEQYCDSTSGTCQTGSCAGTITCNTAIPTCPSGSSPVIANGCYTGTCQVTSSCDAPPVCGDINDETDCLNRANDCTAVYTGIDCTDSSGAACVSGDTGCTCASFSFDHCSTSGAPQ